MYPEDETLLDILDFARLVVGFMGEMTYEQFLASQKDRICVTHEILMLGEACRRLSLNFRAAHSEINWEKWMSLRNSIIHVYHRVDNLELWRAVRHDLPGLIAALECLTPKGE